MTKTDLVVRVAARTQWPRVRVAELVEEVVQEIHGALCDGERVSVGGLGTFDVVVAAARKGRNPRTGKEVDIEPRRRVRFRAALSLRTGLGRR